MDCRLIDFIRTKVTTRLWCNGKVGSFEYDSINYYYRFVEMTQDMNCYLYAERERNDENTPIVLKGLIAFLIACWGQNEVAIYNTYNERKKKAFIDIEAIKPGSFKRDLDQEFAQLLLNTEQSNIEEFATNFDYISENEKSLITEYANNYLEYTAATYKQKLKPTKIEQTFESLLHHDRKTALMKALHELLDDTTGKDVAIILKSLYKLGYLAPPSNRNELYRIMRRTFGNIGTTQNLNSFLKPDSIKILDAELESTIQILQRV